MNVVLAGTVRFDPDRLPEARIMMKEMMCLSRAEDGCIEYVYSEDLLEPGLVHVFEVWRDAEAVHAHHNAPHFLAWRASRDKIGMHDRRMRRYEVTSSNEA